MIIDLGTIPQEAQDFLFVLEEDWWHPEGPSDPILRLGRPLEVKIRIDRAGDKYIVDGELNGDVLARCDRCLEPYNRDLKTSFHLFLALKNPETDEAEVELLDEEMDVAFIKGEEIDLSDIIREQVYLSLPMKSLCSEGCLGLCAICGKDLNQGECQCKEKKGHPGFFKLKNFHIEGE